MKCSDPHNAQEAIELAVGRAYQGPTGDSWLDRMYSCYVPLLWAPRIEGIPDPDHQEPYYRFLYYLTKMLRPRVAVELGTWLAVGSAHIAAAMSENGSGLCFGVDHTTWVEQLQVEEHYPDRFRFLHGESWERVADVRVHCQTTDARVDLIFQDSEHNYPTLISEWELYRPLCSEHHIWVCDDDVPGFPDVQRFIEERPYQYKLRFPGLHYGNCIAVMGDCSWVSWH